MRIISGKFKGQTLIAPKGEATRPSSELVRGAVFNICQDRIEDATFLDAFSGTGAIGLEALSRGAKKVVFIEKDFNALQCIKKNCEKFKVEKETLVLGIDVGQALKRLIQKGEAYDLIFLDPPYALSFQECIEILKTIDESHLLKQDGLLFLEKAPVKGEIEEEHAFKHLTLKNKRAFGKTVLRLYENSAISGIL